MDFGQDTFCSRLLLAAQGTSPAGTPEKGLALRSAVVSVQEDFSTPAGRIERQPLSLSLHSQCAAQDFSQSSVQRISGGNSCVSLSTDFPVETINLGMGQVDETKPIPGTAGPSSTKAITGEGKAPAPNTAGSLDPGSSSQAQAALADLHLRQDEVLQDPSIMHDIHLEACHRVLAMPTVWDMIEAQMRVLVGDPAVVAWTADAGASEAHQVKGPVAGGLPDLSYVTFPDGGIGGVAGNLPDSRTARARICQPQIRLTPEQRLGRLPHRRLPMTYS